MAHEQVLVPENARDRATLVNQKCNKINRLNNYMKPKI